MQAYILDASLSRGPATACHSRTRRGSYEQVPLCSVTRTGALALLHSFPCCCFVFFIACMIYHLAEEIKKELAELEENIQTAAASIKEMKTTRRTLRKELELAQAKEAEEKQAEEIKELTELMKEKGVTVEYLKSLMQ